MHGARLGAYEVLAAIGAGGMIVVPIGWVAIAQADALMRGTLFRPSRFHRTSDNRPGRRDRFRRTV
jgi:hypothetical protein